MTPQDLVGRARELGSRCEKAMEKALTFDTIEEMLKEMNHGEWLCFFASWGEPDYIRALIDAGADVNAKNEYGNTAVMWTAVYGELVCAEPLKKAGAK